MCCGSGARRRRRQDAGEPKVAELERLIRAAGAAKKEVRRLDVAMDDVEGVNVSERGEQLREEAPHANFADAALSRACGFQRTLQVGFPALHHHKDVPESDRAGADDDAAKCYDVRVVHALQYRELAQQLLRAVNARTHRRKR